MATIPRKRRSTRLDERLTPCQACGYVLSQRHHLLPVARYKENEHTAYLCANCHEAYHALERGWLDVCAKRRNTRAMRVYGALWNAYGGRENPAFNILCELVERSEAMRRRDAGTEDFFGWWLDLFSDPGGKMKASDQQSIRRGDTVRLNDGKIVRVVSTQGGYIHTTEGTYGPWQVEKIAKA